MSNISYFRNTLFIYSIYFQQLVWLFISQCWVYFIVHPQCYKILSLKINYTFDSINQSIVSCYYLRAPWLIRERPREPPFHQRCMHHLWPFLSLEHWNLEPHETLYNSLTLEHRKINDFHAEDDSNVIHYSIQGMVKIADTSRRRWCCFILRFHHTHRPLNTN